MNSATHFVDTRDESELDFFIGRFRNVIHDTYTAAQQRLDRIEHRLQTMRYEALRAAANTRDESYCMTFVLDGKLGQIPSRETGEELGFSNAAGALEADEYDFTVLLSFLRLQLAAERCRDTVEYWRAIHHAQEGEGGIDWTDSIVVLDYKGRFQEWLNCETEAIQRRWEKSSWTLDDLFFGSEPSSLELRQDYLDCSGEVSR
jgi:hypothetical protein